MWIWPFYNSVMPRNEKIKEIWIKIDNIHKELHKIGGIVKSNIKDGHTEKAKENSKKLHSCHKRL